MITNTIGTARTDTTTITGSIGQTVVYPTCQRGEPHGYAHHFEVATGLDDVGRKAKLLYCNQCGQVRKLVYEP